MLKGLGDIGNLMKLQKELKNVQKRIATTTIEGESPDGMVKAKVNGEYRLVDIKIDAEFMNNSNSNNLETMVLSAVNKAVEKIKDFSASEMDKLTGGLNIPGIGNFLK